MKKDKQILEHLLRYIGDIQEANEMFDANLSVLETNHVYRHAVCHCIEQIGELAGHLSDEYRKSTSSEVAWRDIIGIRNISAHDYVNTDDGILWATISTDIPELKAFCEKELKEINNKEQTLKKTN